MIAAPSRDQARDPVRSAAEELDEQARLRLGASADTPRETLLQLASDPAVTVRAAVAMNDAASPDTDHVLASDSNERVRLLLARKIAAAVPSLAPGASGALRDRALQTLHRLVRDEAVRVRAAIAAVVKDLPHMPRELILRLAQDSEISVSEPVIRLSPLLTAADLLALLSSPPHAATAEAVARRPGLPASVCDAVVKTMDSVAIRALLGNQTASIREVTLNILIAQAGLDESLHQPLVRRSSLSAEAAHALSGIVTTQLLDELAGRADLSPELSLELRRRLVDRLAMERADGQDGFVVITADQALEAARGLQARGELDEAGLLGAVQRGESRLAAAMLSTSSGVPIAVVERAISLRSAKGLVSLVWSAGFSMALAGPLQILLARLPPKSALPPGPGGEFPLSEAEMSWQLEFLGRLAW